MALYLLFEAASGYALFEVEGMDELAQETDALQQVSLLREHEHGQGRELQSRLTSAAPGLLGLLGKWPERCQAAQLGPQHCSMEQAAPLALSLAAAAMLRRSRGGGRIAAFSELQHRSSLDRRRELALRRSAASRGTACSSC